MIHLGRPVHTETINAVHIFVYISQIMYFFNSNQDFKGKNIMKKNVKLFYDKTFKLVMKGELLKRLKTSQSTSRH